MKINVLPAPTWNKLRVNETEAEIKSPLKQTEIFKQEPSGLKPISDERFGKIAGGLGGEFGAFLEKSGAPALSFETDGENSGVIGMNVDFSSGEETGAARFNLKLGEGAERTVIQYISGEGKAAFENKFILENGSKLTLVQVQTIDKNAEIYNDVGAVAGDNASFNLIQIILGGKDNYYGSLTCLEGEGSEVNTEIAYSMDSLRKLDMNYESDHTGKGTASAMKVNGVLKGEASKTFRGTIDFHRGCAGAVGSETEDVFLLDDTVINKTVPLILCDEEDVEGSHGATIGRADESLLFYMASRGIPEQEAFKLIERAKIDAVASKIPDEKAAEIISGFLAE